LAVVRFVAFGLSLCVLMVAESALAAQPPAAREVTPLAPLPAAQELIYQGEAATILGRDVIGPDGNQVGRIVDVLVDDGGLPRAAVVDVGGFLGIGNRRIAVVWRALHFMPEAAGDDSVTLDMTIDQITAAPEYKPARGPVVVAAPPRVSEAPHCRPG
jgi:hypothetical protein